MYRISTEGVLSEYSTFVAGSVSVTSSKIDYFIPKTVFSSTDYNAPYIIDSYINGTSWYRVWSDRWCEQGGIKTDVGSNATYSVTFLKAFANTNYTLNFSEEREGATNDEYGMIQTRTTTGFTGYQSNGSSGWSILWHACGYIN